MARRPRRPRRTGINYVENDTDRSFTLIKRRAGIFKAAAELSILTGVKVAVVVESERGKMSAFGSPSVGPIINSFLSDSVDPTPDEVQGANIISLEKELIRLQELKVVEDQRARVSMARFREMQGSSKAGKLVYSEIDDLSVDELNELLHGLTRINQEIEDQLHGQKLEIGASGDPLSSWIFSSSLPSQSQVVPPTHFPWTSVQPSLQIPRSSMALPQPWVANMSPLPNESHQYNNQSQQVVNDSNPYGHFTVPSAPSSVPPPPSSLHLPLDVELAFQQLNLNPVLPPQSHDTNTDSMLGNNDISLSPLDDLFYGAYGGEDVGGHDMPGPSGLNQVTYDWFSGPY